MESVQTLDRLFDRVTCHHCGQAFDYEGRTTCPWCKRAVEPASLTKTKAPLRKDPPLAVLGSGRIVFVGGNVFLLPMAGLWLAMQLASARGHSLGAAIEFIFALACLVIGLPIAEIVLFFLALAIGSRRRPTGQDRAPS